MQKLRLAILFSLLIALFGGFGYLLGGYFGLTFALILAFLLNFWAYYSSDKFVISLYRAKPLKDEKIEGMVKKLCKKMGLPTPKIYYVESNNPNAFATGRNPKNSAVCLTTGLLNYLDEKEIEGVISHELAHIKNRDTLISTIAGTFAGAISLVAEMLMWSTIFGGSRENRSPAVLIIGAILAPLAATIVQMAISRSREFYADYIGAMNSSPLGLASALKKISEYSQKHPLNFGTRATAHMFIINPFRADLLTALFSTHPPVEERIRRLEKML
jgi:heat shock protein HtpX